MPKLVLKDGKQFTYVNSFFTRETNVLEFEFGNIHTHEEIFNNFSMYGEGFIEDNLDVIKLTDDEGNLLGTWEGFNDLTHIQNNLQFSYGTDGEKVNNSSVKISLLKETISDEYKRVKENEINSLKEMNLMLMMALAESAELNASDKQSTEIALAELVEILNERGVI